MASKLDIGKMVASASTEERLLSMTVTESKGKNGGPYFVRLDGTGDRKGYAKITVRQSNGNITLEDYVSLPKGNKGFEEDIVLLKELMFRDLGAVASEAVKDLRYSGNSKGHTLSFKIAKKPEAKKAIYHYIDTSFAVMADFFKGFDQIDLAFSLARERVGR